MCTFHLGDGSFPRLSACSYDATLTLCLFESINEFFVFWRLRSCKSQPFFSLFSSFLTLLEPPSPFQINIQKHLIKNPTPHPPLEQDKQIRGCVCSLLAHPIHCFNDLTSTSAGKKKKKVQDGAMQQQNVT